MQNKTLAVQIQTAKQEHEQRIEQLTQARQWTDDGLFLNIPPEKQAQFSAIFDQYISKMLMQVSGQVGALKQEGEEWVLEVKLDIQSPSQHPQVKAFVLTALHALRKKDEDLAAHILNQLQGLNIEEDLSQKAEKYESEQKWREAEICYHALALMHPFEAPSYVKQIDMWAKLGAYDQVLAVCKVALRHLEDSTLREYFEIRTATGVILSHKKVNLTQKQSEKFISTIFKALSIFGEENELDRFHIMLMDKLMTQYRDSFEISDTETLRFVLEKTKVMLSAIDAIPNAQDQPRLVEMRNACAETMAILIYQATVVDGASEHTKMNHLRSLAIQFPQCEAAVHCFAQYCIEMHTSATFIDYFKTTHPPVCESYYHLAEALDAIDKNASAQKVDACFRASYDVAPTAWAAYNLGSFLLHIAHSPKSALPFFLHSILESRDTRPVLGLWACQLLTHDTQGALKTLQEGVLEGQPSLPQLCMTFSKKTVSELDHHSDTIRSLSQLEDVEFVSVLPKPKAKEVQIAPEIEKWIRDRQIDLGNGYIGIPVSQVRANSMSDDLQADYRTELTQKVGQSSYMMTLPLRKHDCWVGKKGKNAIPRIDIEEHGPNGNAPHFQRFRFQRGTGNNGETYGGLWLPCVHPFAEPLILHAYDAWCKSDHTYLVVVKPDSWQDRAVWYAEVYGIDVENRRK